jgi:hypothetical protein
MTVAETASTPLPGETLAAFYERTRDYWVQRAFITSTNQGKELRRDAFSLAEEGYGEPDIGCRGALLTHIQMYTSLFFEKSKRYLRKLDWMPKK